MKIYWKVHNRDFDSFISYILVRYKNFSNDDLNLYRDYYHGKEYIFLLIEESHEKGRYYLSYTGCSSFSIEWLSYNNWEDMGKYCGRKEKLERLAEIVSDRDGV